MRDRGSTKRDGTRGTVSSRTGDRDRDGTETSEYVSGLKRIQNSNSRPVVKLLPNVR